MSCPFTQCPNYNTCPVVNLEFPITQCGVYTARSLCPTLTNAQFPDEVALLSDNATFMRLYREVRIRFDTAPDNYQKQDYQRLLELFRFLDGVDSSFEKTEITTLIGLNTAIDPGAYSVVLPSVETTLGVTTFSMIVLPQDDNTLQIAYFINADGEAKMYERLITDGTPLVLGPWVDSDAHLIHKVLNAEGIIPMFDVNGNLVVSSISSDILGNITISETLTVVGATVLEGGLEVTGNASVDGDLSATGDITGANLSNTNTGDETAGTIIDKLGYTPADDADLTLLEARTSDVESTVSTLSAGLTWKPQISSTVGNEETDLTTAYPLAVEGWIANVDTGTETVSWRFNGLIWEIFNSNQVPLVTTILDGRMRKEDKIKLDALDERKLVESDIENANYTDWDEGSMDNSKRVTLRSLWYGVWYWLRYYPSNFIYGKNIFDAIRELYDLINAETTGLLPRMVVVEGDITTINASILELQESIADIEEEITSNIVAQGTRTGTISGLSGNLIVTLPLTLVPANYNILITLVSSAGNTPIVKNVTKGTTSFQVDFIANGISSIGSFSFFWIAIQ